MPTIDRRMCASCTDDIEPGGPFLVPDGPANGESSSVDGNAQIHVAEPSFGSAWTCFVDEVQERGSPKVIGQVCQAIGGHGKSEEQGGQAQERER